MDKRKQLIDMISDNQGQRYWYKTTFIYMPKESHYPRTWEEFDQMRHHIYGDCDDGNELLLTQEQAIELGDVREFNILLQPNKLKNNSHG